MNVSLLPHAQQHTLNGVLTYAGRGLHSGRHVAMWLKPASANSGIVFLRKDLTDSPITIPALWENVVAGRLCSVIGNNRGVSVSTVEHMLAALRACGVDNAMVELDGPEVPIVDGSAAPFVELIRQVGTAPQTARRRFILVTAPLTMAQGDRFAMLFPSAEARVSVEIDFRSPAIGHQQHTVVVDSAEFRHNIAPARTFGFAEEIAAMREEGYARGGSLTNAIVIDNDRVISAGGLRYKDEFVRHKILDAVGDLALAGAPVIAHYSAYKAGHHLNHLLLHELFSRRDAWRYVDADELREEIRKLDKPKMRQSSTRPLAPQRSQPRNMPTTH